jgi:hypothetical protein
VKTAEVEEIMKEPVMGFRSTIIEEKINTEMARLK